MNFSRTSRRILEVMSLFVLACLVGFVVGQNDGDISSAFIIGLLVMIAGVLLMILVQIDSLST
jgi:uncharacterized membrane protein YjjP (DUF1212 family)